jgi:hypothetical protein
VFPIEAEVHERLVAGRGVVAESRGIVKGDDGGERFGGAKLLDGATNAGGGFGHRGAVEIPFVAVGEGLGRELRAVVFFEIAEEVLLIGNDHLPVGRGLGLRDDVEVVDGWIRLGIGGVGHAGFAIEGIPAEAKRGADAVGFGGTGGAVAGEKLGVGGEEADRLHRIEGLGVAATLLAAAGHERVPFHQQALAVEPGAPIDLVLAVGEGGVPQLARAAADAPPTELGAGPAQSEASPSGKDWFSMATAWVKTQAEATLKRPA